MRPLVLEMNAFGPFKNNVVIDFREFDQSSLFLLTGPTGSGKTTIFDAISYVLYGSASGESREESTLKSDYASDEEAVCYVKLTFTIHNKTVEVYRRSRQKGPGKTKRVIELQPEFELVIDDQLVSNSVKDSTSEIQKLLGLSADQFKQIVMLPQGEFRKLLTSTSSEKEAIFRNIFKTDIFRRFEDTLKEKSKLYVKEQERLKALLDQQTGQIMYDNRPELDLAIKQDDYEALLAELSTLNAEDDREFQKVDKQLSELTKQLEEERVIIENMTRLESLSEQSQALEQEKPEVEAKKNRLIYAKQAEELSKLDGRIKQIDKKYNSSQKAFELYKKDLETVSAKWAEKNKAYEEHKDEIKTIPELEEQKAKLNEEQRLWKDKQDTDQRIKKGAAAINRLNEQHRHAETALKQLTISQDKIKEQLKTIPAIREQYKEKETERLEINEALREQKMKRQVLEEALKDRQILEKASETEQQLKQAVMELAENLQVISSRYYANIAVVLADQLEENTPCPVCGSLDHPNIASTTEEDVSKERVEELEKLFDIKNEQLNKTQMKMDHLNESITKQIKPFEIEQGAIEETIAQMTQNINHHGEHIDGIINDLNQLDEVLQKESKWRKEIEDLNLQIREVESNKQKVESEAIFIQKQLKEWQTKIEEVSESLTSASPEAVDERLTKLINQIDKIQQKEKVLNRQLEELNLKKETLQISIKHTEKNINEYQNELETLQEEFNKTEQMYKFESSYKEYLLDKTTQADWQQAVERFDRTVIETDTKLQQVIEKLPDKEDRLLLSEYEQLKDKTEYQLRNVKSNRDELVTKHSTNKNALEKISELYESQRENYELGSLYTELSDMAAGKDNLTHKISFERYVLGVYFDEILYAANQRFNQMTGGRYELERQTENFSARRGNGLDLEVFDQFTGKKRSVKSLSGGEMFKASLSLAFGLSDVIQNELGGVEVNTLFIDEGFGTLDSDSLDQAIQVLMELNQTGRLIGIISHVDELKTRIQSKITIQKGQEGSHVELIH